MTTLREYALRSARESKAKRILEAFVANHPDGWKGTPSALCDEFGDGPGPKSLRRWLEEFGHAIANLGFAFEFSRSNGLRLVTFSKLRQ